MNEDMLIELFKKQFALQERLGTTTQMKTNTVGFVKDQILALEDELHEALRELPWKPWKKHQETNLEAFREELVDAWHFLINLTLASGMSPQELYERFTKKNHVNHERQDGGY